MERHPLLPQVISGFEIREWLKANSEENFEDEVKRYFTEEEKNEFAHESSNHGREINRLKAILRKITTSIAKGNDEEFDIAIPGTVGIKMLEEQRMQNDDFLEKGFEAEELTVYGIVDRENETMEYFSGEGVHISERSRGLTPKEKIKFLSPGMNLSIASNF